VEAARGGDRDALETLVAAYYDRVHALCRRMLGNEADALDATQDALLAAVRGIGRFDGRSAFGTWMYRVATNACLDELRRRRRRPELGATGDVTASAAASSATFARSIMGLRSGRAAPSAPDSFPAAFPDPFPESVAVRVDLDGALRALPTEFRAAVVLRDVCDLPYEEIAEVLGVPIGTVRSRIARGRALVADTLQGNRPRTPVVGTERETIR